MINKLNNIIKQIEITLGIILLFVLLVIVGINIFFRYFLNDPILWVNELSNYLLIWIGFLACAYVLAESGHITITFINSRIPKLAQYSLNIVINLFMIMFLVSMMGPAIYAFDFLRNPVNIQILSGKHLFSIIPIAFVLMMIHLIVNTINEIKNIVHMPEKGGNN